MSPSGRDSKGKERREQAAPDELVRGTYYLYADELEAVMVEARKRRCSRAEIVRRAVRAYLGMEPED